MTRGNIITKTIWQVFLYFLEIVVIASALAFISFLLLEPGCKIGIIEFLERFVLFYGIYQIVVYIILNNLNDIEADEYLALRDFCEWAIIAVESKEAGRIEYLKARIDRQLDSEIFNDLKVRETYSRVQQYIDTGNVNQLRWESVLADHVYEESRLNWKYSFILRIAKRTRSK